MSAWCDLCAKNRDDTFGCDLLGLAFMGLTPTAWKETNPRGLADRYECVEYTDMD